MGLSPLLHIVQLFTHVLSPLLGLSPLLHRCEDHRKVVCLSPLELHTPFGGSRDMGLRGPQVSLRLVDLLLRIYQGALQLGDLGLGMAKV